MTAVVVRWLDEHPQRWKGNFKNLVLYALPTLGPPTNELAPRRVALTLPR
jgi:hypothetical protein